MSEEARRAMEEEARRIAAEVLVDSELSEEARRIACEMLAAEILWNVLMAPEAEE